MYTPNRAYITPTGHLENNHEKNVINSAFLAEKMYLRSMNNKAKE